MALVREISFFNSFLLKQLNQVVGTTYTPLSPGGFPYNGTSGNFNQQKIGVNTISATGSNYTVTNGNNLSTTGGSGTGLTVDILSVNSTGGITKLKIRNLGNGDYLNGETLTVVQTGSPTPTGATFTIRVLSVNTNSPSKLNFPSTINSANSNNNFFVEESRIRGGYNNTIVDIGVLAYLAEQESLQENRFNSLIYSGIFNSRTGINNTNQFSIGEEITKSLSPVYGSIQKLHAEDNNLIVLQENKINTALIDKDAIYSAEGNATITSTTQVIGQAVPYTGDFGISRNPESFAYFGFRRYFVDKDRNSVLRLSRDGLTEISNYGMIDYFRDQLTALPEETEIVVGSLQPVGNPPAYIITASATSATNQLTITEPATLLNNAQKGMQLWINGAKQTNSSSGKDIIITNIVGQTITFDRNINVASGNGLAFVTPSRGQIVGGFDIHNKNYVVSIQQQPTWASQLINAPTLSLQTGGTGYTAGTNVATTVAVPSIGSGLTVDTTVSGGIITTVTVNNFGNGNYSVNDVITIVGGNSDATFKVTDSGVADIGSGNNATYNTLAYDELVRGWSSFYTYKPTFMLSLKNKYYSIKNKDIYQHYVQSGSTLSSNNNRGIFYGLYNKSSIEFVFNQNSSVAKNFLTVNYEGDNGWQVDSFISDSQRFTYSQYTGNPLGNFVSTNDSAPEIPSYYGGAFDSSGNTYTSANSISSPIFRYGFDLKENKYYAVVKNNSTPANGEVLYGNQISGIKGRYATVTISTDNLTDIAGSKELWSVGSRYAVSSY